MFLNYLEQNIIMVEILTRILKYMVRIISEFTGFTTGKDTV